MNSNNSAGHESTKETSQKSETHIQSWSQITNDHELYPEEDLAKDAASWRAKI